MRPPRRWIGVVAVVTIATTFATAGVGRSFAATVPFTDGFESGTFAAWDLPVVGGTGSAAVQSSVVHGGSRAARLAATSATGSRAYLRATFGPPLLDLTAGAWFRVDVEGASNSNVPLFRLLDDTGARVLSVYRQNRGSNKLWVNHGSAASTSGNLPLAQWARVEVRAIVAGTASTVEVRLDGALIYRTTSAALGTRGVAQLQIGNEVAGQAHVTYVDDVSVTAVDAPPDTTITSGPAGTVSSHDATFAFSSSEPASTFACRLDSGASSPCTSPTTFNGLAAGSHRFEVAAVDGAGQPDPTPAVRTWEVVDGTVDPVLVGAGDIAECNNSGDEATAALLDSIPGTVFTAGDNVYPTGSIANFGNCYQSSWGRHLARTRPAPGNHEYDDPDAAGYFAYYGAVAGDPAEGYYSYDLGTWHVVVLNSNCAAIGGCHAGSPQETWLRADLAASTTACTAAIWHHPRYSSGPHGSNSFMQPMWEALYQAGVDVAVAGHDHDYERFAPLGANGLPDPSYGIRQFVVGTGGKEHYTFGAIQPYSEVRNDTTFGVLKLTLHPGSFDWQFVPVAGATFTDTGTGACHGAPPPPATGFADGFESGGFGAWPSVVTGSDGQAVVQSSIVRTGTRAARFTMTTTTGSVAYARTPFSTPLQRPIASGSFRFQAEGGAGANAPLLRLFDPNGTRLLSLYRQNQTGGQIWVQHSGRFERTAAVVPLQTWASVEVRVVLAGAGTSTVQVSVDGAVVYQVANANVGTVGVGFVQIGNDTRGQALDVAVDDVAVSQAP